MKAQTSDSSTWTSNTSWADLQQIVWGEIKWSVFINSQVRMCRHLTQLLKSVYDYVDAKAVSQKTELCSTDR